MNVALQEGPKGTRIYLVPGDKVTLRATRINYRNPSWAYVSRYLFPRIYIRIFAIYIFTGPEKKKKEEKKKDVFPSSIHPNYNSLSTLLSSVKNPLALKFAAKVQN